MPSGLRPLRFFALTSAALGLLSVNLTGEIAMAWLAASWMAWTFSLFADRYPLFLARVRRLETAAVAGMIAMLFIDFLAFRFTIFIAVTHFLLLFQIVKLLGEKTRKDCLQIFLFSFFQVLAACTLSVDAWHAAVLLGLIPTATAVLFWSHIAREEEQTKPAVDPRVNSQYRRMAAGIGLAAFPVNILLTVAVFVIFPRLKLNATLPGFSGRHTGYADQMNLAQKGRLQQDTSIVLWLSFPRAEERETWTGYLRGDVLSHFDGRRWSASKEAGLRMIASDSNGVFTLRPQHPDLPLLRHTITLADTSASTLFVIADPMRIVAPLPSLQQREDGSLHWLTPRHRPLRYDVVSQEFSESAVRPGESQWPAVPLDRIRDLAQQVAGNGPPLEQARNIEQYLRKTYRYSTDFGDRIPDNPVDYFLFERREGSCAHFASAMTVMLRTILIPSRVVAGYLRGEWNEPAQSVVIRERDAHAWVEAYVEGKGWISFDPSPRQAEGSAARRNWFRAIEQYGVYLDLQWNRFVIQYDLYSQIKAFDSLKGTSERLSIAMSQAWSKLHHWLDRPAPLSSTPQKDSSVVSRWSFKKSGVVLSVILAGLFLIQKHRRSYDSAIRFYKEFLHKMARSGCPKQPWETGEEFAARLVREKPEQTALARQITARYYQIRFGPIYLARSRKEISHFF